MRYLYKCPHCEKEVTIEKSISNRNRVEYCDICENELKRVYEAKSISTSDGYKR